ncbi:hypothetical protein ACQKWADRAFT_302950, partial [Trichoderma austrokoningii]
MSGWLLLCLSCETCMAGRSDSTSVSHFYYICFLCGHHCILETLDVEALDVQTLDALNCICVDDSFCLEVSVTDEDCRYWIRMKLQFAVND